jgi:molecular chaperone Hsp33
MADPAADQALLDQLSASDIVVPFQLEASAVRGRLARLGPSLDRVLTAHAYPEIISRLLGEALTLTALIGTALKFDGLFTLQAQGEGPVTLLVADYETGGGLRGYASFDEKALTEILREGEPTVERLFGQGALALTIDPRLERDRYQGIVPLEGKTLADCADLYFAQSEQIPTRLQLAVARRFAPDALGGEWRAGGLMIQNLPREGGHAEFVSPAEEDDWRRAGLLAGTLASDELVDPTLSADRLLYRLFHEDGVRVFAPKPVHFACRCSAERLERVLAAYPLEELACMAEGGIISARCEFCAAEYQFRLDEFGGEG